MDALPPLDDGLRRLAGFEDLLGGGFVRRTARGYQETARTALDDFDRMVRVGSLHPLAKVLDEYIAIKPDAAANRPVRASDELISLAADYATLEMFRTAWDDGGAGRKRRTLVNRLRSKGDCEPALTEYRLGAFFRREGWDVKVRAGQLLPRADLEIRRGSLIAEVECKLLHPWAGLRIHDPTFGDLFNSLTQRLRKLAPTSFDVFVRCTEALRPEDIRGITQEILRLAWEGKSVTKFKNQYSLYCNERRPNRAVTPDEIAAEVGNHREQFPGAHIALGGNRLANGEVVLSLVLTAGSEKPDDLEGGVIKVIRKAQHQLTGRTFGIVTIYIPQVLREKLTVSPESALIRRIGREGEKGEIPKVSAVLFFWPSPIDRNAEALLVGGQTMHVFQRHASTLHPLPPNFSIHAPQTVF